MKYLVISDVHLKPTLFDRADKLLDRHPDWGVVQMGDLVDDWQATLDDYHLTLRRAQCFKRDHPETLWVMGNHDYGYYHPGLGVRESGHRVEYEQDVYELLRPLDQQIAYIVDDTIFTHAGVDLNWLLRRDTDDVTEGLREITPRDLWEPDSPIWARPTDAMFLPYTGLHQVAGHTPVRTLERRGPVLLTDTHSTYRDGTPIGDGAMAVVETTTGEWDIAI